MTEIQYVIGDVTSPYGDGKKLIPHVCNTVGAWGSGVVVAISKKLGMAPEMAYRNWQKTGIEPQTKAPFALGSIQCVPVDDTITVVNMIGQMDIRPKNGVPPVRYGAIRKCLRKVAEHAKKNGASIHAPKFGSDRAGGDWATIEQIIKEELCSKDIPVTIYIYQP